MDIQNKFEQLQADTDTIINKLESGPVDVVSEMEMMQKKLDEASLPYISVLTDPTMGGVSASFAFLGDIIMAEPGALIGFAGARVIKQTIGKDLPDGFQKAEFLLDHGSIDMVVERDTMKKTLHDLLKLFSKDVA